MTDASKLPWRWIVELEPGVFIADGDGDPPRTLSFRNSRRFESRHMATAALRRARRWRRFKQARVLVTVEE